MSADLAELRAASPTGLPVVEGLFGLDDSDSVKRISDALERDVVHMCFAGSSGSTSVMVDETGESIETSAPSCEFDRIAAVPSDCRAALMQQFRELTEHHASLGISKRNYSKSMEQLGADFPPTAYPLLGESFVVKRVAPPSPPPLPPSIPPNPGSAGAVKPARKSGMAGILTAAVLILLAVGLWPWAHEAWSWKRAVSGNRAEDYARYVASFPNGPHVLEAKSRGIRASKAQQVQSSPSPAGAMPKAKETPPPEKTAAQRNADYLSLNAKRKGVITTASGLQYEVLKAAQGPKPNAEDTVKIYHHGVLTDGNVFESS